MTQQKTSLFVVLFRSKNFFASFHQTQKRPIFMPIVFLPLVFRLLTYTNLNILMNAKQCVRALPLFLIFGLSIFHSFYTTQEPHHHCNIHRHCAIFLFVDVLQTNQEHIPATMNLSSQQHHTFFWVLKWSGMSSSTYRHSSTAFSHISQFLKWSGTNSRDPASSSTASSHMFLFLKWSGTNSCAYELKATDFSHIFCVSNSSGISAKDHGLTTSCTTWIYQNIHHASARQLDRLFARLFDKKLNKASHFILYLWPRARVKGVITFITLIFITKV